MRQASFVWDGFGGGHAVTKGLFQFYFPVWTRQGSRCARPLCGGFAIPDVPKQGQTVGERASVAAGQGGAQRPRRAALTSCHRQRTLETRFWSNTRVTKTDPRPKQSKALSLRRPSSRVHTDDYTIFFTSRLYITSGVLLDRATALSDLCATGYEGIRRC
jgi:hypothetical protein